MGRRFISARMLAIGACALLLVAAGCAGSAGAPPPPPPPPGAAPLLLYPVIGDVPADARLPELFVDPARLRSQVRALRAAGYRAVTLQRVWDAWHGRARLPRRPVVLSFDDGSQGQVRHALALLRAAG